MAATHDLNADDERALAAALFNQTWDLLLRSERSTDDDDALVHIAHASRHHWGRVGTAANRARGEWLCSRVYAVLDRGEPAVHHAARTLDLCAEHGLVDWDLGFAYEALARAYAVSGDSAQAADYVARAFEAAHAVTEDEDRDALLADLSTIPGQPLPG